MDQDVTLPLKVQRYDLVIMDKITSQLAHLSVFYWFLRKFSTDRGWTDCVKLLAKLCLNCHGNRS